VPHSPLEIGLGKIWTNSAVALVAAALSAELVLEWLLGVSFAGSRALFLIGAVLYLVSAAALGVFLPVIARSIVQFALLFFLVILPMPVLPRRRRASADRRASHARRRRGIRASW
jgi:ABC-2 type transport system permease protein